MIEIRCREAGREGAEVALLSLTTLMSSFFRNWKERRPESERACRKGDEGKTTVLTNPLKYNYSTILSLSITYK